MEHQVVDNWYLPETMEPTALFKRLKRKFGLVHEPEVHHKITYCDSFDWRLFANDYLLSCVGTAWRLHDLHTGEIIMEESGPKVNKARFAKAFQVGGLQQQLTDILEMRCVSPIASGEVTVQECRLVNKDEKTVVRLFLEQHQMTGADDRLRAVRLEPVRGYIDELEAVRSILKQFEPVNRPPAYIAMEQGCTCLGRTPGDYSSKMVLHLDPDQTARSAVGIIYKQLLEAMHVNIPGVLADLDSEFLHDFRVAVRRTRSGLSLIKGVLPPAVVEKYKEDFAYLGQVTGPTRDLDVYLLYEDEYKSRLPETLQDGLHSFFENLAALRAQEQRALVRELKGPRVEEILCSWQAYLDSEDTQSAKFADSPVIDIATKIIYRRYKRVLKDGLAITDKTPDREIHRLRIQGKKLRYAIEFFASLFPAQDIATAIKRLKKLQNYLGDFNDLSVQQDVLRNHLQGIRPGSRKNLELGAALGALMSNLHREQVKARGNFAAIFGKFSSARNIALFEKLFTCKKEAI